MAPKGSPPMRHRRRIWSAWLAEIQETHGRVDALVLNAGMSEPASL
jgi:NADP-dependent 3-hydroxy acid dehydrogenase YdfG